MSFERHARSPVLVLALVACGGSGGSTSETASDDGEMGGASASGASGGATSTGGAAAVGGKSGAGGSATGGVTPCTPSTCKGPPAMGKGGVPDGATANVQAITKLYLGDTTRAGVASAAAWQEFGFPISGVVYSDATAGAAKHCKPWDGAKPADVIVNGTNGVDNSFGKNIWPIFLGLTANASQQSQDGLTSGAVGLLIVVDGLGAGSDYDGLGATLYASQGTLDVTGGTVPPTDWATYVWHPFDAQKGGDPFPSSYVVDNHWVSAPSGNVEISLWWEGLRLPLVIHHAKLAHRYGIDHKTATAGDISGVLSVSEFVTALKSIASKISSSLCMSVALDSPLLQFAQAADIGLDGTQDPNKQCDGISIGIGYESTESLRGDPAAPLVPMDACPAP